MNMFGIWDVSPASCAVTGFIQTSNPILNIFIVLIHSVAIARLQLNRNAFKNKTERSKSNKVKSPQVLRWGNVPARTSGSLSSVPSKEFLKQNFHVMHSFPQTEFLCSARGAKTQNFPGSSFLRAKTFRTKCAKPFLTTTLKSALLPLVTLPENA